MARGRPVKLTQEVQARLVAALKAGNYRWSACGYAGIDLRTFQRWMVRGKKDRRGPFRDLYEAARKAEAECEVAAVANWRASFPTHPAEIRHFLARRFPQRWSEKRRLEVLAGRRGRLPRLDVDIIRAEDMTLEQVEARLREIGGVEDMSDRELHRLIDRTLGVAGRAGRGTNGKAPREALAADPAGGRGGLPGGRDGDDDVLVE
jgi:hypothetical protein